MEGSQRTLDAAKISRPELSRLSDAGLARLLGNLVAEVQRRRGGKARQTGRPALDRAVQEALRTLETCVRRQGRRTKLGLGADAVSSLQEPKRKAIRAALLAGVAPGQVAKHFGVSLAVVRNLADEKYAIS